MITGYAGFQTWKAFIQQSTSGLKKKTGNPTQLLPLPLHNLQPSNRYQAFPTWQLINDYGL